MLVHCSIDLTDLDGDYDDAGPVISDALWQPIADAVMRPVYGDLTDDLVKRFSAVDLVRAASAALGGQGGGGRPDMAQAGGPDATKAADAIAAVKAALTAA